jgi:hypothetical protein
VQINIPFGTALTERATLPAGAHRSLKDPYAEKTGGRKVALAVVILLLLLLGLGKYFGFWPFARGPGESEESTAVETMN